jgi:hypothetical protein
MKIILSIPAAVYNISAGHNISGKVVLCVNQTQIIEGDGNEAML